MKPRFLLTITIIAIVAIGALSCDNCYKPQFNENCQDDPFNMDHYTMHMSVHPHLDAFWIFDFESYYDPKPSESQVHSYFAQNRFNSVKQIFNTITNVLWESKQHREKKGPTSQKAHRSFFNSQMGFFKRWFFDQNEDQKKKVRELLKTKYWQIVGGGFVEHDEGCAYYDDIIESYQMGLRFLKENFDYYPRTAVSADSFGHSSTTLAILAHIGVQGYFVERSDEHILLQNKTQFIWKAKSANGQFYGALPTHIRWAIHGFEDQFIGGNPSEKICQTKEMYISNMRRENNFMKRILQSNHIMRYFGHDFQQFNDYSYTVMEGIMEQFSKEKCARILAVYGNPSEYFQALIGQVWKNKVKPMATRTEDIMPIWDYDSGLYWTGYYTTDPYHKKDYRDASRMLHLLRKAFLPQYIASPKSDVNIVNYGNLERLAEQVTYAQHHDGISGTSKYTVMDNLERTLDQHLKKVTKPIMNEVFETQFPINTNNPIFNCEMDQDCKIPQNQAGDIYLKIFNSAADRAGEPVKISLPFDEYYKPDCKYELNCFCHALPCNCTLYLFPRLFTYTPIRLKKVAIEDMKHTLLNSFENSDAYSFNTTHFNIVFNENPYAIGYKKILADATPRHYAHLSRYGDQVQRGFSIRSGKYALGNNPSKTFDFSKIHNVFELDSQKLKVFIIKWRKANMKTVITIRKDQPNQWKIETHSAAEGPLIQDMYLEIGSEINNRDKFYTDSNGWLVMERTLFKHEDYSAHFDQNKYDDIDGNSYPMTAFCYIKDANQKMSVNTDRPQGVIAYKPGRLWINIDRLSTDDGKWVYETTYRDQYQKFTHWVTVDNNNYNQRKLQALYDQPIYIQGNLIQPNERVQEADYDFNLRDKWAAVAGIDGLKMLIKPWNDTTVTVRVHNLNDKESRTVGLFANHTSPLLTTYYGNEIQFTKLQESSLGGNMNYKKFLDMKWNWQQVIDLTKENSIFDKTFQENITLRPLEIRTFTFTNLSIVMYCQHPSKLTYTQNKTQQKLDIGKEMTVRKDTQNQGIIAQYLLNGDHCTQPSPVLMDNLPGQQFKPQEHNPIEQPKKQEPKPEIAEQATPTKPEEQKLEPQQPNAEAKQLQANQYQKIRVKINHLEKIDRSEKFTYFTRRFEEIEKDNGKLKK